MRDAGCPCATALCELLRLSLAIRRNASPQAQLVTLELRVAWAVIWTCLCVCVRACLVCQRFERDVGGRALATDRARTAAKIVSQNCAHLLPSNMGGIGEKRHEFLESRSLGLWLHGCKPECCTCTALVEAGGEVRGFEKGLAGGGWRLKHPQKNEKIPQKCISLLLRGHRKRGTEKRPQSLVWEGFLLANPLCPPTLLDTFEEGVGHSSHDSLSNGEINPAIKSSREDCLKISQRGCNSTVHWLTQEKIQKE